MMTISGHNPNQHTILNSKPPKYLERRVDNCVCLLLRPGGREAHLDAEAEDGRLDLCFAQRAIGVIFASHTVGMTVSGALYIGANFDPVSPVLTLRQGNASEVFRMQWPVDAPSHSAKVSLHSLEHAASSASSASMASVLRRATR